jgi:hypothetical protein
MIFGTKIKLLVTQLLSGIICPHCKAGELYAVVYQKLAHIFWMPVFPLGKTGATSCAHCKQVLKEAEMPAEIKQAYAQQKSSAKTPITAYWGIAVLVILFLIGKFADK